MFSCNEDDAAGLEGLESVKEAKCHNKWQEELRSSLRRQQLEHEKYVQKMLATHLRNVTGLLEKAIIHFGSMHEESGVETNVELRVSTGGTVSGNNSCELSSNFGTSSIGSTDSDVFHPVLSTIPSASLVSEVPLLSAESTSSGGSNAGNVDLKMVASSGKASIGTGGKSSGGTNFNRKISEKYGSDDGPNFRNVSDLGPMTILARQDSNVSDLGQGGAFGLQNSDFSTVQHSTKRLSMGGGARKPPIKSKTMGNIPTRITQMSAGPLLLDQSDDFDSEPSNASEWHTDGDAGSSMSMSDKVRKLYEEARKAREDEMNKHKSSKGMHKTLSDRMHKVQSDSKRSNNDSAIRPFIPGKNLFGPSSSESDKEGNLNRTLMVPSGPNFKAGSPAANLQVGLEQKKQVRSSMMQQKAPGGVRGSMMQFGIRGSMFGGGFGGFAGRHSGGGNGGKKRMTATRKSGVMKAFGMGLMGGMEEITEEKKQDILGEALGAVESGDEEHLELLIQQEGPACVACGSALVRAVARAGNMEMLEMLKQNNYWKPGSAEGTKAVIEGAVTGGQLPTLLQFYELPLDKFPHIAHDFVYLMTKYPQLREKFLDQASLHHLLASFIVVPGRAAEELLEMITEEVLGVCVKESSNDDGEESEEGLGGVDNVDHRISEHDEEDEEDEITTAARQSGRVSKGTSGKHSVPVPSRPSKLPRSMSQKMKSHISHGNRFSFAQGHDFVGSNKLTHFTGGMLSKAANKMSMGLHAVKNKMPVRNSNMHEGTSSQKFGSPFAATPTQTEMEVANETSMGWVPMQSKFPETLNPIYLRPEVTESAIAECAEYWPEKQRLVLYLREGACELTTSKEMNITTVGYEATHIPTRASRFAFIYGNNHFRLGGFLYVSLDGDLLTINSMSLKKRQHAFWFGKYQTLDKVASDELVKTAYPATQGTPFWEVGVRKYTWVCPNERLGNLSAGGHGGFAYFFEDEAKNRFFPVIGAGETIDRGCVSTGINAANLDESPTSEDLKVNLVCEHREHGNYFTRKASSPMRMARLTLPGATHISVLHALTVTTRLEVLDTLAAKAIIQAAWAQVEMHYHRDVILEGIRLWAVIYLTYVMRATVRPQDSDTRDIGAAVPTFQNGLLELTWDLVLCLLVLIIFWVRSVIYEAHSALVFYRARWSPHWVRCSFEWLDILIMGSFMALVLWSSFPASTLLPILAIQGFWRWIKVLDLLRGYDGVGSRILPIILALKEIAPFGSVLLFFISGFVHAFYAISHRRLGNVFLSTYRMGVLADLDVGMDVLGVSDEDRTGAVQGHLLDSPLPWSGWQYVMFIFTSFLFTVAMMNIFIGIMSQAYSTNLEMADKLFLRSRASLIVKYAIRRSRSYSRSHHEKFVWFGFLDIDDK